MLRIRGRVAASGAVAKGRFCDLSAASPPHAAPHLAHPPPLPPASPLVVPDTAPLRAGPAAAPVGRHTLAAVAPPRPPEGAHRLGKGMGVHGLPSKLRRLPNSGEGEPGSNPSSCPSVTARLASAIDT